MIIQSSPKGFPLCATYKNQMDTQFQDAVLDSLLSLARRVPDGMLVFMPSYRLLYQLKRRWEHTGESEGSLMDACFGCSFMVQTFLICC
jgi:regulator of telomere elongation helicase 1